jgi:hypothetical protein
MDIRQAEVPPCVTVSKFFVVETQQMENGRVQVVNVDYILDSLEAKFIRRAMNVPAFDTATGQPH